MTIRVMHRTDREIEPVIYENVEEVVDAFSDNGALCRQIIMKDGSAATYPVCEWTLWKRTWTRI